MPRLLIESFEQLAANLEAHFLRQKLREQLQRDQLLDHIASVIARGWFAREVREANARLARAPSLAARKKISADNQIRLILLYQKSRPWIEAQRDAESAEGHGLRPEDLKNRVSGKRKRRKKTCGRRAPAAYLDYALG